MQDIPVRMQPSLSPTPPIGVLPAEPHSLIVGDARLEARVATEHHHGVDWSEQMSEVGLPQIRRGTLVGKHQGLTGQLGG